MPSLRRLLVPTLLLVAAPLWAQKESRQPLTEAQVDQIREAGIDPDARIKLYTKFAGEHIDAIKALAARGRSSARTQHIDNELQDLAALMDELGSNLDQYGDRKADMRKSLKALNEAAPRWVDALHALPAEPGFNVSRDDALESTHDLAGQVADLYKDQSAYFAAHKDEKGQERAEPQ